MAHSHFDRCCLGSALGAFIPAVLLPASFQRRLPKRYLQGYLFIVCPCCSHWGPSDTRAPCLLLLATTATRQAHVTAIFAHLRQRHDKDKRRLQVAICAFSPVCHAGGWWLALNTNVLLKLLLPAWQSFFQIPWKQFDDFQQVSLPQRAKGGS